MSLYVLLAANVNKGDIRSIYKHTYKHTTVSVYLHEEVYHLVVHLHARYALGILAALHQLLTATAAVTTSASVGSLFDRCITSGSSARRLQILTMILENKSIR